MGTFTNGKREERDLAARRIVNLTFHGLGWPKRTLEREAEDLWLSEETFRSILDEISGRSDVRITIDDGNASDVDVALPALLERGMTADFFVLAGALDAPGHLSRADLRRLADEGMSIGSHGMSHRPWRRAAEAALHEELIEARAILEHVLGRPVRTAACPFGSYDRRVLLRLREAGYERVFTSDPGATRPDAWLQPRFTIRRGDAAGTVRRLLESADSDPLVLLRRIKQMVKRWR
jgi:peptidoglycan/xylan/chitin deacetylase (PgdA/CDA1 family)